MARSQRGLHRRKFRIVGLRRRKARHVLIITRDQDFLLSTPTRKVLTFFSWLRLHHADSRTRRLSDRLGGDPVSKA